jgi:hypothetical protein
MIGLTVKERDTQIVKFQDPSFKGAFLRSFTALLYKNQMNFKDNKKLYHFCKEHFMSVPVVIFARKNYFLLDVINKKILTLQAAGLIEFWHSNVIDKRFMKIQPSKAPTKLTIEQLSGSFILLISGLTVGLIAFAVEFLMKLTKKYIQKYV